MPSQMEIAVGGRLEKVLEQGLRVHPGRALLFHGRLAGGGAEKALIPEQKKRMPGWMAAVCAAAEFFACWRLLGFISICIRTLPLPGIVTETVLFWPDDEMTANGYLEAKQAIEDKYRILAGEGNYIIQDREDGAIEVTAPLEAYQERMSQEVCRDYISSPATLTYDYQDITTESLYRIAESDILDAHLETGTLDGIDREKR